MIDCAKEIWTKYWRALPDEQRLRLAGMEEEIRCISRGLERGLWALVAEHLEVLADQLEGRCECGRRRERRKDSVEIDLLGHRVEFPCTYLYCRHCHYGVSPVRAWLGLEHGGVSMGFERALTDLTTRMTFGDAVDSMSEHHDQEVDRTKAERVTYQVGREAEEYLRQRRHQAREKLRSGEHDSVEQLVFTADGGAIPVGILSRPAPEEARADAPRTEIRKLPKGTRAIAGREARFVTAHPAHSNADRVVDCHIAPYEQTRYTGERMFATAAEAGLGDKSRIHGVFDMGKWIHSQFEERFVSYERTACADIMHVAEYLVDAGRVVVGQQRAFVWAMERKRRLLGGEFDEVLAELSDHQCRPDCTKNEHGTCLVQVAHRYLDNNQAYMKDYEDFMIEGLPVGSGEAESGIRHVIKKRMHVAGAWEEGNAVLMLALITIRASGWWDDFWQWRAERDRQAWHDRREGRTKVTFRAKRRRQHAGAA
jgi:hypothetical protein